MNRYLRLLYKTPNLHTPLGYWRIAVATALQRCEPPLPWPGSLSCGPLIDGAVRETLPAGAVFPSDIVWYLNAAKLVELLHLTLTRDVSHKVIQMEWKAYDTSGTLQLTVRDNITYSAIYEIERIRTVVT